jgi:hypothetical protein
VRVLIALAAVLVQGCIFLPRTTTAYDEECQLERRQMRLEAAQIGAIGHCSGRECAYALVAIGAVAAASAVVSGSIVVVGNVVYWLERQGRCALA